MQAYVVEWLHLLAERKATRALVFGEVSSCSHSSVDKRLRPNAVHHNESISVPSRDLIVGEDR